MIEQGVPYSSNANSFYKRCGSRRRTHSWSCFSCEFLGSHLVLPLTMLVPQRSRHLNIFRYLPANNYPRTRLLFRSGTAPFRSAERGRLYPHSCRVLPVGQEAHTRAVHPRWMPRGNRGVRHAHRDKDASNPIRREHRCRGWPLTQCHDVTCVGRRQLRWRSEEGGCDRNSHRAW